MKHRLLMALVLCGLFSIPFSPVYAQHNTQTLTTQAAACASPPAASTGYIFSPVSASYGAATITLGGTWTGTVSFFASGDGAATWQPIYSLNNSQVDSGTTNNTWQFNPSGYTHLCAAFTTATSGTVIATIQFALPSAGHGGSTGGGGSGCVPAGSTGQVLLDSGSGACNDSALATDNGTTFTVGSGALTATNAHLTTPALGTPSAVVLTHATGLPCGALPALTGDTTTSATSCATTTVNINGTAFAGTSTHLVAFGAGNTPADSAIVDTAAGLLAACTGCAPLASPAFTGTATATTQAACDNSTKLATDAYVNGAVCNLVETSGSPLACGANTQIIWNNTASTYVCDLPTAAAGLQVCIGDYKARAGAVSFVPATGATIYFKGVAGTTSSSTGLVSGGAAGDFICVVGGDSTTWMAIGAGYGTWTNN